MLKGFILFTVLMVLISPCPLYAQGAGIYFGAHPDTMENSTGRDAYYPLPGWPDIIELTNDSLELISNLYKSSAIILDGYINYHYAHYAIVQAENNTDKVRFRNNDGLRADGFVYGPEDSPGEMAIFLDSLWYEHETGSGVGPFKYGIRVNIDMEDLTYNDTLGFLRIRTGCPWGNPSEDVDTTFYIVSDPFLDSSSATCYLEFEYPVPPVLDWIQVATFQERTLGIDYFKVSNAKGRRLVENGMYIAEIIEFAELYSDHILFWYLREEPQFTHCKPFEVIKNALESCVSCGSGNIVLIVSTDKSPVDLLNLYSKGTLIK